MVAITAGLWRATPGSLVPDEDQGFYIAAVVLPDGSSLERTDKVVGQVVEAVKSNPYNEYVVAFTGFDFLGGTFRENAATIFVTQKHWDERPVPVGALVGEFYMKTAHIKEGLALAFPPPAIFGLGNTGGFEFYVQNNGEGGPQRLAQVVQQLQAAAMANPKLTPLQTLWRPAVPQRRRGPREGKALGVPLQALRHPFGDDGFVLRERLQPLRAPWRVLPRVKQQRAGRERRRGHRGNGARREGSAAPGVHARLGRASLGKEIGGHVDARPRPGRAHGVPDSRRPVREVVAAAVDPPRGALRHLRGTAAVWGMGLVRGFFGSPPLANDVYFQIGLVTLIGLASKNAILIVEYAMLKHGEGLSYSAAALEAARLRFRPILMTSLAFILGVLPLVLSTGAGAGARNSVGTGVMGGMLAATFLAIFFVPFFFKLIMERKFGEPRTTPEIKAEVAHHRHTMVSVPHALETHPAYGGHDMRTPVKPLVQQSLAPAARSGRTTTARGETARKARRQPCGHRDGRRWSDRLR
jgi:HAE1 family hydrophobic/amphiphilic exporter-1/multidrug efflux pump